MSATRLVVTAASPKWARTAADVFCGNATSVIACDCEAGLERVIAADESPDGRPGVSLLVFAFSRDALAKAVTARVGSASSPARRPPASTACMMRRLKSTSRSANSSAISAMDSRRRSCLTGSGCGGFPSWMVNSSVSTRPAPSPESLAGTFCSAEHRRRLLWERRKPPPTRCARFQTSFCRFREGSFALEARWAPGTRG